jgi:hypothetical protein
MPDYYLAIMYKDLSTNDLSFLVRWARNLDISVNELLKRILLAAVAGNVYSENPPRRYGRKNPCSPKNQPFETRY